MLVTCCRYACRLQGQYICRFELLETACPTPAFSRDQHGKATYHISFKNKFWDILSRSNSLLRMQLDLYYRLGSKPMLVWLVLLRSACNTVLQG